MEQLPSQSDPKKSYFENIKKHDCIVHVEEGLSLNSEDYLLTKNVPEGLELDVQDLRDSAIRFLNSSIIADSFASHDERVAWYNASGILQGGNSKLYLANKLRINIIGNFLRGAKVHGGYLAKWHDKGRFHAPTKLPGLCEGVSLQNYDHNSVDEKLALVARVELIAKTAINEMIEFGWIEGEKIT